MANPNDPNKTVPFSFYDFPEDVQLCILAFLAPTDIAIFACTSKRFVSLCGNDAKLWFSMCDRKWGSKTDIRRWGNGKITYKQLYKSLDEYDNLIGFWRRSGQNIISNATTTAVNSPPPLVFFEWGPFFITGSRVSPSKTGTYNVIKSPFLWMGITAAGEPINFLDPECRLKLSEKLVNSGELGFIENELVPVSVNSIGKCHVVIEESMGFAYSNSPEGQKNGVRRVSSSGNLRGGEYVEDVCGSPGSLPDRLMSEIYQYFANRTSPPSRRQRKREKERQVRRKWEPEHFVKIVNYWPTASRPLQGLWKGICHDMNLEFYLVTYDDIGGIACRSICDSSSPFSGYAPVCWTSNATTFIESPFSCEEEHIYDSRVHLRPRAAADHIHEHDPCTDNEAVSRILYISSSYDLFMADITETTVNPRKVVGRIWQYGNGTFGFGFLRDNYIIDLKHIAQNGCFLDTMETL